MTTNFANASFIANFINGFFTNGNRLWFGDSDFSGSVKIMGDDLAALDRAAQRAISRQGFDPATEFVLIPILDELDDVGGQEGDVMLCVNSPIYAGLF